MAVLMKFYILMDEVLTWNYRLLSVWFSLWFPFLSA